MNIYLRLMKIFEIMWLVAAAVSLIMAITRAVNGQSYGSYIYITIFTACVAYFMYRFKKKSRKFQEEYYKKKEQEIRTRLADKDLK